MMACMVVPSVVKDKMGGVKDKFEDLSGMSNYSGITLSSVFYKI